MARRRSSRHRQRRPAASSPPKGKAMSSESGSPPEEEAPGSAETESLDTDAEPEAKSNGSTTAEQATASASASTKAGSTASVSTDGHESSPPEATRSDAATATDVASPRPDQAEVDAADDPVAGDGDEAAVAEEAGSDDGDTGTSPAVTGSDGDTDTSPATTGSDSDTGTRPATMGSDDGDPGAGSDSAGDDAADVRVAPVARPPGSSRQRAIRAGLSTLPLPDPGPSFWADLDAALAEQGKLAITARPAIRPITEPPPLSQPSLGDRLAPKAAAELAAGSRRGGPELLAGRYNGNGSNRRLLVLVIVVLAALLAVGIALGGDEDPESDQRTGGSSSTTLAQGEVTTTLPGPTAPPPPPQVPGLAPDTPLSPNGVGPLQVGLTRRDLQGRGIETTVDQASFQTGEGRCFSGGVLAAADLVLWFRSPDPNQGVADPLDGVLAAVSVNGMQGSPRATESALRLGAPKEQVVGTHPDQLDTVAGQAGEQVYLLPAAEGSGNGVAYVTDGAVVTKINVGLEDVIAQPETCTA